MRVTSGTSPRALPLLLVTAAVALAACGGTTVHRGPSFSDREFLNQAVGHCELGIGLMDRGASLASRPEVRDLARAVGDEERASRERLLALKQELFGQQATPVPLKAWIRVPENDGRTFDQAWLRQALRHAEATETVAKQADIPASLPRVREEARAMAEQARSRRERIARLIDAEP